MAMTSDSGRALSDAERDEFLTSGAIFAKVAAKIVLDSGRPVDLTILRESGK
mgnify:CR=1 FL=1